MYELNMQKKHFKYALHICSTIIYDHISYIYIYTCSAYGRRWISVYIYIYTIPLCTIYPIKSCSIPLPDDNIMLPKQIIHMML